MKCDSITLEKYKFSDIGDHMLNHNKKIYNFIPTPFQSQCG